MVCGEPSRIRNPVKSADPEHPPIVARAQSDQSGFPVAQARCRAPRIEACEPSTERAGTETPLLQRAPALPSLSRGGRCHSPASQSRPFVDEGTLWQIPAPREGYVVQTGCSGKNRTALGVEAHPAGTRETISPPA